MRVATLALVMLALPACESEGERAEAEYNIFVASGPNFPEEQCRRASAVREAYLRDRNQPAYVTWQIKAMEPCLRAETLRLEAANRAR